jgi:hypothetical protein
MLVQIIMVAPIVNLNLGIQKTQRFFCLCLFYIFLGVILVHETCNLFQ